MKAMRTIMALSALAGVAALAACTHGPARLSFSPDYGLFYNDQGETAALAYGLPNSDDVALMLQCAKGSARVELTDTARDAAVTAIVLTADGRRTSVPVRAETSEAGESKLLTGQLPLAAPALQGFRRSGVIEVSSGRSRYAITVGQAQRPGIERFFKVCG